MICQQGAGLDDERGSSMEHMVYENPVYLKKCLHFVFLYVLQTFSSLSVEKRIPLFHATLILLPSLAD